MANWRLVLCEGCGGKPLADAIAEHLPDVTLERAPCLSVCDRPATLAAQGDGRATYVFAGIGEGDIADIAAFARKYQRAPQGWIEDARPLGRLRFQLVARVPA